MNMIQTVPSEDSWITISGLTRRAKENRRERGREKSRERERQRERVGEREREHPPGARQDDHRPAPFQII